MLFGAAVEPASVKGDAGLVARLLSALDPAPGAFAIVTP
jgi:hypothetical protein